MIDEVEHISKAKYEESLWMKVRGQREKEALYLGCIYMPTVSDASSLDTCYELIREDVLSFKEKGKVVLLGDFNARVGKSVEVDDVIGMFGEEMCNSSGNRLISFLNEVDLVICNSRKFVSEPEWTRVRPSLNQKSIIDYIVTDTQTLAASGHVNVDRTDIGCSDHSLVWMELGRIVKNKRKAKRVIRKWRVDRFENEEIKQRYQNELKDELHEFSQSIRSKLEHGLKGHTLKFYLSGKAL